MEYNEKTGSQTARARDAIRDLIVSGDLAPGSNHLESDLAGRLGMSRTPVREATLMLQAQGLLEVQPRRGVRIQSLSESDMQEIYEILTELEGLAAWRAASAGFSASDLAGLAKYLTGMEKALDEGDRERWAWADEDFHDELIRLSGNSRIAAIVSNFNDQVRRARQMTLYLREPPLNSNKAHRALYVAILQGDAPEAQRLHREHRIQAGAMIIGLIRKMNLKTV
jgi:DNA-binding GntR family transcriptional regulator